MTITTATPATIRRRTTEIEWTEHTWNPFVGCSVQSAGCKNCYAMKMATRLAAMGDKPSYAGVAAKGVWTGRINRATDAQMRKPFGLPLGSLVFVNSMSDFWHIHAQDAWRAEALDIMRQTPGITYQVLTKRPQNIALMLARMGIDALPDNVWIGATVEDHRVVHRIDHLRHVPARVRFLSIEPITARVGPIDLSGIHWVITGGESGPGARPCDPDWVREVRDQCEARNVPHFFKQWGQWSNNPLARDCPEGERPADYVARVDPIGKGGSLLDGQYHKAWPRMIAAE